MEDRIGKYIKDAREKKEISQEELGKMLGISRTYITKIENEKAKKIDKNILFDISKTLNINFIKLLELSNYTNEEINEMFTPNLRYYNDIPLILYFNNEDKIEKYKFYDKEDKIEYIDIEKVLNGYKNNELTKEETIILINSCKPLDWEEDKLVYPTENGNITIDLI